MKQGMTKKLAPKDKHSKASWKKRDEGRKGKQEAFEAFIIANANTPAVTDPDYKVAE